MADLSIVFCRRLPEDRWSWWTFHSNTSEISRRYDDVFMIFRMNSDEHQTLEFATVSWDLINQNRDLKNEYTWSIEMGYYLCSFEMGANIQVHQTAGSSSLVRTPNICKVWILLNSSLKVVTWTKNMNNTLNCDVD